jgi:hypothetical protein
MNGRRVAVVWDLALEVEPMISFPCKYCSCFFFSKADLESHYAVFHGGKMAHRRMMKEVHEELEKDLWRSHGGADRAVQKLLDAFDLGISEFSRELEKRKLREYVERHG